MNDPSGGDPAGVVQQQPHSSFGQTDLINGDLTPESDATARFQGNDKLLCAIILGVVAFWLFAQTTLNIAPDMGKDLGLDTSTMNIAVAITALFSGIFIVVMGGLADRVGRVKIVRIGFYLSILGSLLVGFAPTGAMASPFLLSGRAPQGLSGACIMPASLVLVKTYWGRSPAPAYGWRRAHAAVPAGVVPSNAQRQMMHIASTP